MRPLLLVVFVAGLAQGIFVVLFVLFVARCLHGGAAEIGLLRGVQAVGAIAGGLALGVLARRCSAGRLVAGGALAFGLLDLVIWNLPALTVATPPYVALFVAIGAPGVLLVSGLVSQVQLTAAPEQAGRAFGALALADNSGQAAGLLAAGLLVQPLGLLTVLDGQAALYLAAAGLAGWGLRRSRAGRGAVFELPALGRD